uniref:Oocyst capsule protein n=1 Tax=Strongyloides venezuelensis TaxID=75913 RepID=A0A0K0F7C5_STRVS
MEIFNYYLKKILVVIFFVNVSSFLNEDSICNLSKSSISVSLYSLKYQFPLEQSENGMPVFLGRLNTIIHVKQSVNFLCINENLVKDIFNTKLYRTNSKHFEEQNNNINEIQFHKINISEKNMIIYKFKQPLISGNYRLDFEKFWGYINVNEQKGIFTQKSLLNHYFVLKMYMSDEYSIPFPTIFSSSSRSSFELDIIHPQNTTAVSSTKSSFNDKIGYENMWQNTKFKKTNSISFSNFGFFILPSEYKIIMYNESLPSVSLYYNWIQIMKNEKNIKSIYEAKTSEVAGLFKEVNIRFSDEILIKNIYMIEDNDIYTDSSYIFNSTNTYSGIIINSLKCDLEKKLQIILQQFIGNILKFEPPSNSEYNAQKDHFIENNINNVIIDDIFKKSGDNDYEKYKIKRYLELSIKDQLNFLQNDSMTDYKNISIHEKANEFTKFSSVSNTLLTIKNILGEKIFKERLKQYVEIYKFNDVEEDMFWSMMTNGFYSSKICFCDVLKILKYWKSDLILRIETDKESLYSFNFINKNTNIKNDTIPIVIELSSINGKNNTRKQMKLPIQFLTKKLANIERFERNNGEILFLSNIEFTYNYRTFYDYYLWKEIFQFMKTYPSSLKISEKTYLIETFCYQLSYDGIENYNDILSEFKKQLINLPVQPINCLIPAQNI